MNKTKKRFTRFIACALCVLLLLPTAVLAKDSDFIIEDGILFEYTGSDSHVVIPEGVTQLYDEIDGFGKYFGTEKNYDVFGFNTGIKSVEFPSTLKAIGFSAFNNCTGLASVTIPSTVEKIGGYAFAYCSGLQRLEIQPGVTSVGMGAFSFCKALVSATIPDTVTTLDQSTFYGCENLKWVKLSSNVQTLHFGTFGGCDSLETVILSENVTEIADGAFVRSSGLTIVAPEGSYAAEYAKEHGIAHSVTAPPEPETSVQPEIIETVGINPNPNGGTAYASAQTVTVDGKPVVFEAYALKEGDLETNYVKIRDVAYALNGTAAQFEVGYAERVVLTTGKAYTVNGSEMKTPFSGDRSYKCGTEPTVLDEKTYGLTSFILTDDNGGDYTYYKLRDLGMVLGFNVGWSEEAGVFIQTDRAYTDAD